MLRRIRVGDLKLLRSWIGGDWIWNRIGFGFGLREGQGRRAEGEIFGRDRIEVFFVIGFEAFEVGVRDDVKASEEERDDGEDEQQLWE